METFASSAAFKDAIYTKEMDQRGSMSESTHQSECREQKLHHEQRRERKGHGARGRGYGDVSSLV